MSSLRATFRPASLFLLAVLSGAACSESAGGCGEQAVPDASAFEIQLRSKQGPLPSGTYLIDITTGASQVTLRCLLPEVTTPCEGSVDAIYIGLEDSTDSMLKIHMKSGPQSVTVNVARNGVNLASKTFAVIYGTGGCGDRTWPTVAVDPQPEIFV
jgi:hypothetical protein